MKALISIIFATLFLSLSTQAASDDYYCKEKGPRKWIRCSRKTGQCFGAPFEREFQCLRAIGKAPTRTTPMKNKYCRKKSPNHWQICDSVTGQCYGKFEKEFFCKKAISGTPTPSTPAPGYYCKNVGPRKWVTCSDRTGQCFGREFEREFQCVRALPKR